MASLLALLLPLQCLSDCSCETICPGAGVFACVGLALLIVALLALIMALAFVAADRASAISHAMAAAPASLYVRADDNAILFP